MRIEIRSRGSGWAVEGRHERAPGGRLPLLTSLWLSRCADGTTIYITRDIGAAAERYEKYKFDKMIYVVASQQNLHLAQFFKVLELMDYPWAVTRWAPFWSHWRSLATARPDRVRVGEDTGGRGVARARIGAFRRRAG
jgi:hypothetical protein